MRTKILPLIALCLALNLNTASAAIIAGKFEGQIRYGESFAGVFGNNLPLDQTPFVLHFSYDTDYFVKQPGLPGWWAYSPEAFSLTLTIGQNSYEFVKYSEEHRFTAFIDVVGRDVLSMRLENLVPYVGHVQENIYGNIQERFTLFIQTPSPIFSRFTLLQSFSYAIPEERNYLSQINWSISESLNYNDGSGTFNWSEANGGASFLSGSAIPAPNSGTIFIAMVCFILVVRHAMSDSSNRRLFQSLRGNSHGFASSGEIGRRILV